MKNLIIIGLLLGICLVYPAYCVDLSSYLKETTAQSDKDFLKNFPYQDYLKKVSLKDIDVLETQRKTLNQNKRDGDKFLYLLCQHHIENSPKNIHGLTELLNLSQMYLHHASISEDGMVYEILGNTILEEVANQTESQIKEGKLNKNNREVKTIIGLLKSHQFIINIPQSDWEKLSYHIRQGNWAYICDRMYKETGIACLPLLIVLFLGMSLTFWYRKNITKAFYSLF